MSVSLAQAIFAQESGSEAPRLALLIGNAAYGGSAALKNPDNDVEDMAAVLSSIGWKTRTVANADRRTIGRALTAFREELIANPGTIAMFFKVQTSLEEARRLLEETRQLQLSGGVQIAEAELYAVRLTKDLQGLRTVRELRAFTFDDDLLMQLDNDQKVKIYTAAKKNSALLYAALNLLPSLGSFSQGNYIHGLFQLGSIAAFFANLAWISSFPDSSDVGPMGSTLAINGASVLVSYGFGFVAPFMYQGNFNKGVRQVILYEP